MVSKCQLSVLYISGGQTRDQEGSCTADLSPWEKQLRLSFGTNGKDRFSSISAIFPHCHYSVVFPVQISNIEETTEGEIKIYCRKNNCVKEKWCISELFRGTFRTVSTESRYVPTCSWEKNYGFTPNVDFDPLSTRFNFTEFLRQCIHAFREYAAEKRTNKYGWGEPERAPH